MRRRPDPGSCRIALIGLTAADARDVLIVEGRSGIVAVRLGRLKPLNRQATQLTREAWPPVTTPAKPDHYVDLNIIMPGWNELCKVPQTYMGPAGAGLGLGHASQPLIKTTPRLADHQTANGWQ
jgi:phage terminase large subunit-like protein